MVVFQPYHHFVNFYGDCKSDRQNVQYGMDIESSRIHCRYKSAVYYDKDDERVPNKVSNLFVLAGQCCYSGALTLLATVPGLEAIYAVVIKITAFSVEG